MKKQTKQLAPPTLLLIEWIDAGVITQGDWLSREEVLEQASPEHFMNHTVGWLIREDSSALVVAAQVAIDSKEPSYDLVMWIPKSLIRKRKIIS